MLWSLLVYAGTCRGVSLVFWYLPWWVYHLLGLLPAHQRSFPVRPVWCYDGGIPVIPSQGLSSSWWHCFSSLSPLWWILLLFVGPARVMLCPSVSGDPKRHRHTQVLSGQGRYMPALGSAPPGDSATRITWIALGPIFFAPRRGIVCLWTEISYIWHPGATLIKQNAAEYRARQCMTFRPHRLAIPRDRKSR